MFMKNSKMILAVVTMMTVATVSAINDPHVIAFGRNAACRFSTNDESDNGNILHKIISHHADEGFEFRVECRVRPHALEKEFTFSSHDEHVKYMLEQANAIEQHVTENIKTLLSTENQDGKTPKKFLEEKKDSMDPSHYALYERIINELEKELHKKTDEDGSIDDFQKTLLLASVVKSLQ